MGDIMMKSSIVKHSIVIHGHKTSVSLEDAFWNLLMEIANERDETARDLVAKIDKDRHHTNLSSAIRLFGYARDQAKAGARRSEQIAKRVNGPKAIEAV